MWNNWQYILSYYNLKLEKNTDLFYAQPHTNSIKTRSRYGLLQWGRRSWVLTMFFILILISTKELKYQTPCIVDFAFLLLYIPHSTNSPSVCLNHTTSWYTSCNKSSKNIMYTIADLRFNTIGMLAFLHDVNMKNNTAIIISISYRCPYFDSLYIYIYMYKMLAFTCLLCWWLLEIDIFHLQCE